MLQSESIALEVPAPFSLKATVLSHGWHECAPMSWCEGGSCFQVIERAGRDVYRISVIETRRTRRKVTLRLTVEGDAVAEEHVEQMRERVRSMLKLDHNISDFHAICRDHPRLSALPAIGAGRTLRSADMTENIVKALCATNVNWTQAVKMINRLCQLGPPIRHFRSLNAWPTPREILRAGEGYLTDVCRLGYRVKSILNFCRDVCDGKIDPERLIGEAESDDVTTDELLAALRAIGGIGPASAHFLLSILGRYDRLSIDSATIAHVTRTHLNGKRATNTAIERIYEPYGRWKNHVWWFECWLMWDTARGILREAGLDGASDEGKPPQRRAGRYRPRA